MAFPSTLLGDHICIQAEAFTGNLTNVYTPSTGKKIVISGWSLWVNGNTAGVCDITIVTGSTAHASARIPASPAAAAAGNANPYQLLGVRITGGVNEVLKINGGATGATISGVIFITEV
jgi:hypothetical protein